MSQVSDEFRSVSEFTMYNLELMIVSKRMVEHRFLVTRCKWSCARFAGGARCICGYGSASSNHQLVNSLEVIGSERIKEWNLEVDGRVRCNSTKWYRRAFFSGVRRRDLSRVWQLANLLPGPDGAPGHRDLATTGSRPFGIH